MKILVLNAGSSSLKYQLIDMDGEKVLASGNCERIGIDGQITHKTADGRKETREVSFPTHTEAFLEITKALTTGDLAVISDLKEIGAIGHRVLHGSEVYKVSTLVTDKVIADIEAFSELGPLHNPPQAATMKACRKVFGADIPMVAVFDTSFHQTMPAKSYIFGIPYEYYEKYSIRRYGFHGTSHRYVTQRYAELKGTSLEGKNIITCHLGNGSSISAIKDGKCYDTSMGFTPLDGFIMGTRSGAVDPSVITYIQNKEHLTADETIEMLNKKSGFLGLSGVSSDARDIEAAADSGNKRAQLTVDMVRYQVKKFIGAYAAGMGGVDAIIFTGGIGENSFELREEVCQNMEFLGLKIDTEKNKANNRSEGCFSTPDSKVEAWIIPTNEELMIAKDTLEIISK